MHDRQTVLAVLGLLKEVMSSYVTEVKSASQRLRGGEESMKHVSSICIVRLGHEYM